jgi:hypothetical protein
MVEPVLRTLNLQSPHAKRLLVVGLVVAIVPTALLIVAVLTDFIPVFALGILAAVGMAALVISDLRRRDGANHSVNPKTGREVAHAHPHPPHAVAGAGTGSDQHKPEPH